MNVFGCVICNRERIECVYVFGCVMCNRERIECVCVWLWYV